MDKNVIMHEEDESEVIEIKKDRKMGGWMEGQRKEREREREREGKGRKVK